MPERASTTKANARTSRARATPSAKQAAAKRTRKTTTKTTAKKAAATKRTTKTTATTPAKAVRRTAAKRTSTTTRRAPTKVSATAKRTSRARIGWYAYAVIAIVIFTTAASVGIGMTDTGAINTDSLIRNQKEQATPEERVELDRVSRPRDTTQSVDGGLVPSENQTPKARPPVAAAVESASTTATSSEETAADTSAEEETSTTTDAEAVTQEPETVTNETATE